LIELSSNQAKQYNKIEKLEDAGRGKLSCELGAGSREQGVGISMRRIKHNPKTMDVVTYYCGRNIFYFRIYSDLASASTYDCCLFFIFF
jgi:hypothetical protein